MAAPEATRVETSEVARHIARVAARLFAEKGYDATSVREIVEAAGVAKPTVYYHFGSKEGLAQAVLSVPLSELAKTLGGIVAGVSDPIECLVQVLEAQFAFCREDPDRARFHLALFFGPPGSELAGQLEPCKAELTGWAEAAVRRLVDAGILARDRVEACEAACRGLLLASILDFLYRDRPLRPDLARQHVHDLLRGFGMGAVAFSKEPGI
jgi:AcrR family transcriptional regulator